MKFCDDNTVLVLGAGASAPYGFPCGKGLREMIIRDTKPGGKVHLAGSAFGLPDKEIEAFRSLFEESSIHETIDSFLEHRPKFRQIGALAIVSVLANLEKADVLAKGRGRWYHCLLKTLDFRKDTMPPVSGIVTFNYDRSLEHFLRRNIEVAFDEDLIDRPLAKLARVPMIYVHGNFGALADVPYGGLSSSSRDAELAVGGIALAHDDANARAAVKRAREVLMAADRVLILGFGFDRRNVQRIGLDEFGTKKGGEIRASSMGLSDGDLALAIEALGNPSNIHFFEDLPPLDWLLEGLAQKTVTYRR